MKIVELYDEWCSSIDVAKIRVAKSPSLVFLCGGPISQTGQDFKSCRDIFHQYLKNTDWSFKQKVTLAEQVFEYFKHSAYNDLLRFERDLAELSALTVIFSESPGAIAELGSFAVLKNVRERLLVVLHQDDAEKDSFIWRGPVLHLKNLAKESGRDNPISVYHWQKPVNDHDVLQKDAFSDAADLAETIQGILSKSVKSAAFDNDQLGHVMLLMLDVLKVIQLATLGEVVDILGRLGIRTARKRVDQHLSLLISLELAVKMPYGNNVYYLSTHHEPWIVWAYKSTAKVNDIDRWQLRFREFYRINQERRHRALQSHMQSSGLIGD